MTRGRVRGEWAALLAGAVLAVGACGRDDAPAPGAGAPAAAAPRASAPSPSAAGDPVRGRQVWMANCVACHNPDPSKDGTLGPAVKGAPSTVLEARVLRAEYPAGYMPKRATKVMPPRPDLAAAIPDLAAYLR